MKISVVLSAYNGAEYITEQLDSIRNQSRPADEVLIFDDVSTDNTVEIVREYIKKYNLSSWWLYENKENYGWKKNFMFGMNMSSGDLIFSADQDDIWMPEKFEIMHRIMSENSDINVLASALEEFFDDGHTNVMKEKKDTELVKLSFNKKIFDIKYPGCTYCIRGEFFKECMPLWRETFPHDAMLWRNAIISDSLAICNTPLIKWRKHNDSAYSVEARKGKSKTEKIKWTFYAEENIEQLENYIKNKKGEIKNFHKKTVLLKKYRRWIILRRKFYKTKNIFYGIKLLGYMGFYVRFRQYLGDWYITYFKGDK